MFNVEKGENGPYAYSQASLNLPLVAVIWIKFEGPGGLFEKFFRLF